MMLREEILSLVQKIYDIPQSEEETENIILRLRELSPHSKISDLIYWNPIHLNPEQVVDEALRRDAEYRREHGETPPAS